MAHPNEELLKRGYAAFQQQDIKTLAQVFSEDISWKATGNSPFSGEFNGHEEVFANFAKIPELTDSFDMQIHDIVANDDHAVAIVAQHVERDGKSMDGNAVHVYHVDDGRVTSAWIIPEDQAAWEAFWSD